MSRSFRGAVEVTLGDFVVAKIVKAAVDLIVDHLKTDRFTLRDFQQRGYDALNEKVL